MEQNANIDEQLKKLLEGLEVQPGMQSFDAIARKLDAKRKRRRFIFFTVLAAALLSGTVALLPHGAFAPGKKETVQLPAEAARHEPADGKGAATPVAKENTGSQPESAIAEAASSLSALQTGNSSSATANFAVADATHLPEEQMAARTNNKSAKGQLLRGSPAEVAAVKAKDPSGLATLGMEQKNRKGKGGQPQAPLPAEPGAQNGGEQGSPSPETSPSVPYEEFAAATDSLSLPSFLPFIPTTLTGTGIAAEPQLLAQGEAAGLLTDRLKKRKKINCYLGIAFAPQYSRFLLTENTGRKPIYDSAGGNPFSAQYREGRKKQNKFTVNYSLGLKLDLVFNKATTLSLGFGMQRYSYTEKLFAYKTPSPGPVPVVPPSNISTHQADVREDYRNTFFYYYYSLEADRHLSMNKWMTTEFGLGLRAEQLRSAEHIYVSSQDDYFYHPLSPAEHNKELSPWLYTLRVKMGWKIDMGSRFRLKLTPAVFYSVSSMFGNDYVLRQKPYGVQLETALMFRLF